MNAHANAEDGDEERPKAEARNTHKRAKNPDRDATNTHGVHTYIRQGTTSKAVKGDIWHV